MCLCDNNIIRKLSLGDSKINNIVSSRVNEWSHEKLACLYVNGGCRWLDSNPTPGPQTTISENNLLDLETFSLPRSWYME
jgi:hypothetical protein